MLVLLVDLLLDLLVDLLRRLVVDLPNMVLHSWRLLVVLRFRLHETASSLL
jgi:hypothetical protein